MKFFWCCRGHQGVDATSTNAPNGERSKLPSDNVAGNGHQKGLLESKSQQIQNQLEQSSNNQDSKELLMQKLLKDIDPCTKVEERHKSGMLGGTFEDTPTFFGMFPLRQAFVPRLPYPLWDTNWETNSLLRQQTLEACNHAESLKYSTIIQPSSPTRMQTSSAEVILKPLSNQKLSPRRIITRHVILIRHGQYDETGLTDDQKVLTELGKRQAKLTGKRLAELVEANDIRGGCCSVRRFSVSQYTRAIQTADIIYHQLLEMYQRNEIPQDQRVTKSEPDPLLNEGVPAHFIPGEEANSTRMGMWTESIGNDNPRIEQAFQKYIGNSEWLLEEKERRESANEEFGGGTSVEHFHEYEIIVSHANLIRYITCRSLQIPPEIWLRFEIFNASLTYLLVKSYGHVVCRMIGDVGHFPYDVCSVDQHDGFAWEDSDELPSTGQSSKLAVVNQIKSLSTRLVPQFVKTNWY